MKSEGRLAIFVLILGIVGLFILGISAAFLYSIRSNSTTGSLANCSISGYRATAAECCYGATPETQPDGTITYKCKEAAFGVSGTPTFFTTATPTPAPTSGGGSSGCGPAGCDGDTRPQCFPYVPGSSQLTIQNSDCSVKRTGDSCTQKNSSGQSTGVAGKCQNAPSCSCVANVVATPTQSGIIGEQLPTLEPTAVPTSADVSTPQPTSMAGTGDSSDPGTIAEDLGAPTTEPTLSPDQIANPNVTVEPTQPFPVQIGYDFVSGITAIQTNLPRIIITFLSLLFVVALGLLAIALIINEYVKRQNN